MGQGVNAACGCGYFEPDLSLGGDMDGMCMLFPAHCPHCARVVTVDVKREQMACPICRSADVVRYDAASLSVTQDARVSMQWGSDVLRESGYCCPKCGGPTLGFESSGEFFD